MAGVATGLDFAAVLAFADSQGADVELLTDVLPDVEPTILAALAGDDDDSSHEE